MFAAVLTACVCIANVVGYPSYYNDIPDELMDYVFPGPREDIRWPQNSLKLGQVAGIETGPGNQVYLFHRGSRKWGMGTFLSNYSFARPEYGPITEETIVTLDGTTGKKLGSRGANMFYMPHGLTLDKSGNLWITDVALHQVMRFPKDSDTPDLTLGVKLTPGSDDDHFCQPTDVAVASNGDFFVSDGYCNSRIMKFSKDGKLLKKWGQKEDGSLTPMTLHVPHSLALIEEHDMLCVADRENARVLCYNAGLKNADDAGKFMKTLVPEDAIGNVYAIAFDPSNDVIYAVVNPSRSQERYRGFTVSLTGQLLETWWMDREPNSVPHDVTVTADGTNIYVGDIGTGKAVKLSRNVTPVETDPVIG